MRKFQKYILISSLCLLSLVAYSSYQNLTNQIEKLIMINNQKFSPTLIEENMLKNRLEFYKESLKKNPNEILYSYVSLPLDHGYGANLVPLLMSALITTGDLLELGVGMFSTPLLHKIAFDSNRMLVSVETNYAWLSRFLLYNKTESHKIYWLEREDAQLPFPAEKKWGIVLIDQLYKLRSKNVIKFANLSEIVVVHDTEKIREQIYGYEKEKIGSYFKYACKFSLYGHLGKNGGYSSTTMYSNYINVEEELKPIFDRVNTTYGHKTCDMSM